MTFFDYLYVWVTKMTGLAIIVSAALMLFYFLVTRRYARPWAKFLNWLFTLAAGMQLIHDAVWKGPDWFIQVNLGKYIVSFFGIQLCYQHIWELLPYTGWGAFFIGVGVFMAKQKRLSTILIHTGTVLFASFYVILATVLFTASDKLLTVLDIGFGPVATKWLWLYTSILAGVAAYQIIWSLYNLRLSLKELDPEVIKRDLRTFKDWIWKDKSPTANIQHQNEHSLFEKQKFRSSTLSIQAQNEQSPSVRSVSKCLHASRSAQLRFSTCRFCGENTEYDQANARWKCLHCGAFHDNITEQWVRCRH